MDEDKNEEGSERRRERKREVSAACVTSTRRCPQAEARADKGHVSNGGTKEKKSENKEGGREGGRVGYPRHSSNDSHWMID